MCDVSLFRHLLASEISVLEANGCEASDWGNVQVAPGFMPEYLRNTRLEGAVRIGHFNRDSGSAGNIDTSVGIYNACLRNVMIGNGCLVRNVGLIQNYEIGDGAIIRNADKIVCTLDSTFGNNISVPVLIETGGREVMIYDNLTSQEAYLMSLHRYRTDILKYLFSRIEKYANALVGQSGRIGKYACVENVKEIRDVRIGAFSIISGVCRLECGTVLSSDAARTEILDGVIARDFIIKEGTQVSGYAMLNHCFVGKSCHIGQGFSAVNSLFFANCHFENGEACSLWAGPFSVSHHKATLLIACQTSFFNAGSGSNQSNHSYKLGPNKYGILERGVKLASGSYVYWPMRVGAFSTVLGHHTLHADLSSLPFSYLVEACGKTLIVPAVALRSVGVMRDVDKWPQRDGRVAYRPAGGDIPITGEDLTTFSLFNPYVIARIDEGIGILKAVSAASGDGVPGTALGLDPEKSYFSIQGAYVSSEAVRRGIALYENALHYYTLGVVAARVEGGADLQTTEEGSGDWCDYGGYIAPRAEVEKYWNEALKMSSPSDIHSSLFPFSLAAMDQWEWNWVCRTVENHWGIQPVYAGKEKLKEWITLWKKSVEVTFTDFFNDAKKEFAPALQFIYGLDGTDEEQQSEFRSINGSCDSHPFIQKLLHRKNQLLQLAGNAEIKLCDS